jgi:hypothetical protein
LRRVNVQCLQTLLLPGTELRAMAGRLGLRAGARPPYGVTRTDAMTADDFRRLEAFLDRHPRLRSDTPTTRFVGRRLPDLFPERVELDAAGPALRRSAPLPGVTSRRALVIRGSDLFGRRDRLAALVRRAVREEPDILWQFVLAPTQEEPLDLLDGLVAELRRRPDHLLDRYAVTALHGLRAARRVLVLLSARRRWDPAWVRSAEALLARAFF